MADNGWIYSGRTSVVDRTDEWTWKTDLLVRELARGSKAGIRPTYPCTHCNKRHRQSKEEMKKHLWRYGYMRDFVTTVEFTQYERDRGEVMRQRINGNEGDGIRNLLDDFHDADMPDSPPSHEPPELEEPREPEDPEPSAKAFYDLMASAKRPLYEGSKISQLDAISQALAKKYGNTRS